MYAHVFIVCVSAAAAARVRAAQLAATYYYRRTGAPACAAMLVVVKSGSSVPNEMSVLPIAAFSALPAFPPRCLKPQ